MLKDGQVRNILYLSGIISGKLYQCVHIPWYFPEGNSSRHLYGTVGQMAFWLKPSRLLSKTWEWEWVWLLRSSLLGNTIIMIVYFPPTFSKGSVALWSGRVALNSRKSVLLHNRLWLSRWEVRKNAACSLEVASSVKGITFPKVLSYCYSSWSY